VVRDRDELPRCGNALWPVGVAPVRLLVYDGEEIAHVISAYSAGDYHLHYTDSWPDYSLLCARKNAAGVRARKSDLIRPGWRITAREFQRVILAALLYTYPAKSQRKIRLTRSESRAAEPYQVVRSVAALYGRRPEGRPGARLRAGA
jgi:hypothetical protein